ncbi:MAG: 30S ribosome-binding factor RbfA [Candidatus Riflebacteria bacterium]|nr:30S ribosome-binding factor RbfA [Candidatus Riflebacteria bacterium]
MTAYRKERVESQIQRELSLILQRKVQDPRVAGIHICSVKVSPDFHLAHIFYSTLLEGANVEEIQKGLDSAKAMMRNEIRKVLTLRKVPELAFKFDSSIKHGDHMLGILKNLQFITPTTETTEEGTTETEDKKKEDGTTKYTEGTETEDTEHAEEMEDLDTADSVEEIEKIDKS